MCDLFITLVHGTWPRNVWRDVFLTPFYGKWPSGFRPKWLWFADSSEFRNRLTAALSKRGLSARISPFLWSGANSVRERDKAAHKLVEHIRAKQSDYPSSTQVVIAHSHGGNVALRALDQLGVTGDEIFIATIATPFVEILRTKLSSAETRRVDFMVSATTSFLIPHYAIEFKNAYFPTFNQDVFIRSIHCRAGRRPYLLLALRIARQEYSKIRRACGTDFPFLLRSQTSTSGTRVDSLHRQIVRSGALEFTIRRAAVNLWQKSSFRGTALRFHRWSYSCW